MPEGYLPDASWCQDPSTANDVLRAPVYQPPPSTLSNGMATPGHRIWYQSAKELLYDHEDVFQSLHASYSSPSSRPKLRVAMFRKFWDHLREMGLYWDTSNETYEDKTYEDISSDAAAPPPPDTMDIDKNSVEAQPTEKWKAGPVKQTYKGSRIGTGRDMPFRYREDTVCAFVETVAMAFRCTIERPYVQPKLKLQNILIPVPQAGIVYRCPQDRDRARRGILEGPLLAVQCNHATAFQQQEGEEKADTVDDKRQGATANLLREVGLMLNLAQKRAREGRQEPVPGDEKWWVTKPRWGGGPGGEVPRRAGMNNDTNDDVPEGSSKGTRQGRANPLTAAEKRAKRSPAIRNWKSLEPGPKQWERGVEHLQIGKDRDATGDDVGRAFFYFCKRILAIEKETQIN